MARAYSQDLRDRVIKAALGGVSVRQAAARYEVGVSTAIRCCEILNLIDFFQSQGCPISDKLFHALAYT
jgi:hypothetical protein